MLSVLVALVLLASGAPAQEAPPAAGAEGLNATDTLIQILEDEAARNALIDRLRGAAGAEAEEQPALPVPAETIGKADQLIAELAQDWAQSAALSAQKVWTGLVGLPTALAPVVAVADAGLMRQVAGDLALLVIATYVLLYGGRFAVARLFRRNGGAAGGADRARLFLLSLAAGLGDAAVVVAAWALGYALVLGLADMETVSGIRQSLYLNAFLLVELSRVALRIILRPERDALRVIALPQAGARALASWIGGAILLLGYGQLLIVPIVNQAVSYLSGSAFSTAISLVVILMAIVLVLRWRGPVSSWLRSREAAGARDRLVQGILLRWHVPALIYLIGLLLIVAARPGGILMPLLQNSAILVLAILAAMAVINVLNRSIRAGISVPEPVRLRLPALETRLNRLVPRFLYVLRLVVIAVTALLALDALGFSDFTGWLSRPAGQVFLSTAASVIVLLLAVFLLWLAFASWIDYRLNPDFGTAPSSRETTLLTLLKNAATIALAVLTLMFVLSELGLNIAPLIASAGVLGLAIGFGAQKLVQDIITGVFIQFENAINVGDVITVGGITGTVEKLTIRSVSLRDVQGVFHIIPFSSVDLVSNYTRDFGYFVCDMGVAYREDTEFAKQAMFDAFDELKKDEDVGPNIIGELEWFGLQSFGDSAVILRARIKTVPGTQWGTGRAYNGILKRVFDARGIEIPFPHQTIYFGEDRDGNAPPLNVRNVSAEPSQ
ncbi:MAG: mechanosensitive ion channel domain-containing protein [Paracoccaceae bacterium]